MLKRGGLICKVVGAVCVFVWNLSEDKWIPPLGRFAPYVFGGIVWSWPRKIKKQ